MVEWVKEKQKSNRPKQHSQKSSRKWRSRESLRLQESRVPFFRNEVLIMQRKNRHGLAPCWVSAVLEMALTGWTGWRSKTLKPRRARSDPTNGRRESDLGSTAYSWGTTQARLRSFRSNRFALVAPPPKRARSGEALADIPAQPSRGNCRYGLLHRAHANLWRPCALTFP